MRATVATTMRKEDDDDEGGKATATTELGFRLHFLPDRAWTPWEHRRNIALPHPDGARFGSLNGIFCSGPRLSSSSLSLGCASL